MTSQTKRDIIFDGAADVFAQYGFRRTSMHDIAEAAGISRAALYLLFNNKDDLFKQLAAHRQTLAIDAAIAALSTEKPFFDRFTHAILTYERLYYEPVAASPHGAELMDMNLSVASESMKKGHDRLIRHLTAALKQAHTRRDITLTASMSPKHFVSLLLSSVNGQKAAARSVKDFRNRIKDVTSLFFASLITGDIK